MDYTVHYESHGVLYTADEQFPSYAEAEEYAKRILTFDYVSRAWVGSTINGHRILTVTNLV